MLRLDPFAMRIFAKLALVAGFGLLCFASTVRADVAVLLEEPYSYDGALAGTGHTAVYLSRVCAETPTMLRRCKPGENGVVLSRYHDVGNHDWIAIPLLPYLYAVDRAEDVPLIADPKIVAGLRNKYRLDHLQSIVPNDPSREIPEGNWVQLVGSAYDRTLYVFQVETTQQRDDEFIAAYNAQPNEPAYKLVNRNCADFVREAVNFYYPKAAGRSVLADLGVSTPKHVAKSFFHYANQHPELVTSAYIVPQVPGSIKRSKPIHGLVDSIFKAQKYAIPLIAFHPFVAGGVGLDYLISGRFNPPRSALVFSPDGTLSPRLSEKDRRGYEKGLEELARAADDNSLRHVNTTWRQFQEHAQLEFSDSGGPVLRSASEKDEFLEVGLSDSNVVAASSQSALARELLISRLRQQLRKSGPPKISEVQFHRDWDLLQRTITKPTPQLAENIRALAGGASLQSYK